ncbi:2-dehydropantoate 2-reductase [Desulfosporosinus acididurans]|uniref:2-dehydropantoate 2-reductase n=1 Tax=Desulfosporosinus acididurans TaxID=476652 RepID=A0A0J1FVM4_9FIRM|nr:2-dehydropantoate 2-reductase [Desulfosporosinus acididurans]KLU67357.1 2-dehydropantoate 2-reductase [Desulfosporosinus acididurans]
MEIKKVSIIGLGALGILFGHHLSKRMPQGDLSIIADQERIRRYQRDSLYCNGERCQFNYLTPEDKGEPADLLIFAVKYNGLQDAVKAVKNQVGEHTIILSALNGISSERIIGQTYGMDKILYCVAQGMDAVKVGNQLTYAHMGMLVFGEGEPGLISERVKRVAQFLKGKAVPYEAVTDMNRRMWGKFMLNVGVNQTVAVYKSNYGGIQKEGAARDTMIAAMREVMVLSEKEGINLTETDLTYWLNLLDTLNPEGKPSMRQDMEARRFSEVELFSGAVLELGVKYGVATPVNQELYRRIKVIETQYD